MSNVNQYTKFAVSWGTATDGEPRSPFASLPATVALLEAPPIRVPAHYIKGKRGGRFYACRGEKGCSLCDASGGRVDRFSHRYAAHVILCDDGPSGEPLLLVGSARLIEAIQHAVGDKPFPGAVIEVSAKKRNGRNEYTVSLLRYVGVSDIPGVPDPVGLVALPWPEPVDGWLKQVAK